jgi:predicted methyltransferase
VLGGFTMHRISGDSINPTVDTAAKIASVKINRGNKVLDTCLGLGYTAIAAARLVGTDGDGAVTTIEYDKASLEVASYNPWSQGLFDGSLPITILEGAC